MRKYRIAILSIVLVIAYVSFLKFKDNHNENGEAPVIIVNKQEFVTSVKDNLQKLLNGIEASDKEDGSLTNDVFIESISPFDETNTRTVSYAVFDSDDNLSRATSKVRYRDYKKPEITLVKPVLITYLGDKDIFKSYVKADSSVDGNISDRITVDRIYLDGDYYYIDYSVTDSCGGRGELKAKVNFIDGDQKIDIDINLTTYQIEVKQGTKIDPLDYIKEFKKHNVKKNYDLSSLDITSNYNANEPGFYDIFYEISLPNGDYGITKLSVIVK